MTGLEIDEGTCPYITSVGASESVILLWKTASAPTKLEKLLNMPATKRILLSPWLIAALVLSSTVASESDSALAERRAGFCRQNCRRKGPHESGG